VAVITVAVKIVASNYVSPFGRLTGDLLTVEITLHNSGPTTRVASSSCQVTQPFVPVNGPFTVLELEGGSCVCPGRPLSHTPHSGGCATAHPRPISEAEGFRAAEHSLFTIPREGFIHHTSPL
jgi:hypothetical protein